MDELPRIIERLKEEGKKYILVSDPPFNIGYHYKDYNDNQSEEDYFNMLQTIFENEVHVLIHYPEVLHKHSWLIGDFPEKVVSWVYNSNTAKQHRDIAFYGVKPDFRKVGQPYKNPTDKRIQERIKQGKTARLYDWWEINQVKNVSKEKTEHPCQMPIEVMDRIIGILPDDVVIIDPFLGSGSTGVACVHFNKDFIGIDMDSEYCKIAVGRMQSAKSQTQLSNESCPNDTHNKDLTAMQQVASSKCPSDTSLNPDVIRN
jgi:hypothetical protein